MRLSSLAVAIIHPSTTFATINPKKFEKVFKEIVPYLCDHELFHAYVKDSPEGSYEFLYYIKDGKFKKYKEVKE